LTEKSELKRTQFAELKFQIKKFNLCNAGMIFNLINFYLSPNHPQIPPNLNGPLLAFLYIMQCKKNCV